MQFVLLIVALLLFMGCSSTVGGSSGPGSRDDPGIKYFPKGKEYRLAPENEVES